MKVSSKLLVAFGMVGIGASIVLWEYRSEEHSATSVTSERSTVANAISERPPLDAKPYVPNPGGEHSINIPDASPQNDRWADPSWRSARFNEAIIQVEARYGRFFKRLNWSPQRIEDLKQQLAQNQLAIMKVATAAPLGIFTPEEAASQQAALDRVRSQNEADLRASLGEQNYRTLEVFQHADTYRDTVGQIANSMRAKGVDVTVDLEDALAEGYAQAMDSLRARRSSTDAATSAWTRSNDSQNQKAFQIALLHELSGIVPKQQLDTFLESQQELDGGG